MSGGLPKLFRFSKSVLGKDPEAKDADGAFLRAMTSAKMKGKATILGMRNQQFSPFCLSCPFLLLPPGHFRPTATHTHQMMKSHITTFPPRIDTITHTAAVLTLAGAAGTFGCLQALKCKEENMTRAFRTWRTWATRKMNSSMSRSW